jgi:YhcH/YjgK/YiaL family protein
MKRIIVNIMVLTSLLGLFGCSGSNDPAKWSNEKIDKWFEKGDWKSGWKANPDISINKKSFALSYFKNKERWEKAFDFMKDMDLAKLELKRLDIDGDNLYVIPSEYNTKNPEDARYEAHRKYIDIQYVVSGKELIGIAPLASQDTILQQYDAAKDIEFLSVKNGLSIEATPEKFFIFFPEDAHEPGLKIDTNTPVRKVVVKVKID